MNLQQSMIILNIHTRVTEDELKSIYHKKALEVHPDVNKDPNAGDKFKLVNAAYQFLLKNLHLMPKPRITRNFITFYRVLDNFKVHTIKIPKCDDEFAIQFIYGLNEYRIIFPANSQFPKKVELQTPPVILTILNE